MLLLGLNAFLMLTAYYLLKTVREPLILVGSVGGSGGSRALGGAELKTYASAAQAVLLVGLIPVYARLVNRVSRAELVNVTGLGLVGSVVLFYVLGKIGAPIGLALYLWLGVASLVGVAQFWSFAADYYSREQGERLFPVVAAGGSLGAIVGARFARKLLDSWSPLDLLLVSAALFAAYLGGFALIERLAQRQGGSKEPGVRPDARAREAAGAVGAFRLIRRSRYVLLIACAVVAANFVNTQGEFILARAIMAYAERVVPSSHAGPRVDAAAAVATPPEVKAERQRVIGRVYGTFYSAVNLLAFVMQLFVVSRVFKALGVHGAYVVFPLVVMGSYGLIAWFPIFSIVGAAKAAENSIDYSLHNTSRHALFLPTDRDSKYKAKVAVDSVFFRLGDLAAAVSVFAGIHVFGLGLRGFASINVVMAALWWGLATLIARRYRALAT